MTKEEAKDQAAKEVGYDDFTDYLMSNTEVFSDCHSSLVSGVIDRAMEIYAEVQVKEIVDLLKEKATKGNLERDDKYIYITPNPVMIIEINDFEAITIK